MNSDLSDGYVIQTKSLDNLGMADKTLNGFLKNCVPLFIYFSPITETQTESGPEPDEPGLVHRPYGTAVSVVTSSSRSCVRRLCGIVQHMGRDIGTTFNYCVVSA
ncbi:hypothetical protein TNCV_3533381 [Trichonephila clavipes]|nr:hypothetical protein TNCV_3533381 [Trichonephila clavipes]